VHLQKYGLSRCYNCLPEPAINGIYRLFFLDNWCGNTTQDSWVRVLRGGKPIVGHGDWLGTEISREKSFEVDCKIPACWLFESIVLSAFSTLHPVVTIACREEWSMVPSIFWELFQEY